MSLLQEPDLDNPGVHALLIGIGNYPFLEDGKFSDRFGDAQGMGQLASPPRSIAALTRWLIDHHEMQDGQSLRSLAVLCSGNSGLKDHQGKKVATANFANVRSAVDAWFDRGDSHPDNLMFFYFCGHGVTTGAEHSLLLENFGDTPRDPFYTAAMDIGKCLTGMRRCKAKRQIYLIDACRTVQDGYLRNYQNSGAGFIDATAHSNLGEVQQAVLWSTSLGHQAFGDAKRGSLFASSMLEALKGAACTLDDEGAWVVKPIGLKEGLDMVMRRHTQTLGQIVSLDQVSHNFPFHYFAGDPKVPATVRCKPTESIAQAKLQCRSPSSGFQESWPAGEYEQWQIDLHVGDYEFSVTRPPSPELLGQIKKVTVFPPGRTVVIDCQER